jgi:hypothetical protein
MAWSPTRTRDDDAAELIGGRRDQLAAKEALAVKRFDLRQVFEEFVIGAIYAIEVTDVIESQRQGRINRRNADAAREILFVAVGLESHRVISSDMLQRFYSYSYFLDRPNPCQ